MSAQSCPMNPSELQGMLMECDAGKTVYLLKDALVTGDVAKADVKQIGHKNLYFLKLTLDPSAAATLNAAAQHFVGTELALSFHGSVLTSVIIDSQFTAARLVITGQYDKSQATKLAGELTSA
jgi:preprotein translocase subunit SecD